MRKRILAIALCLVMVSAFVITSIASATKTDNTSIRQFDIVSASGVVAGKLTIDTTSGHYTVTYNPERVSHDRKILWKDLNDQYGQYEFHFTMSDTKTGEKVDLGVIAVWSDGGCIQGEGTLGPTVDLNMIARWNPSDVSVVGIGSPPP